MRVLMMGTSFGALLMSCISFVLNTPSCVSSFSIAPAFPTLLGNNGVAAPGRWGHHSPLPQYRLAKTGVAVAKRRARKARFWQGDGHGRP